MESKRRALWVQHALFYIEARFGGGSSRRSFGMAVDHRHKTPVERTAAPKGLRELVAGAAAWHAFR